jgi:hypothetical protein
MARPDLTQHVCPRCGAEGDPRLCTCMKTLRRRLDELRAALKRGENFRARGHLTEVERTVDLLALDAKHQASDNRPRHKGNR